MVFIKDVSANADAGTATQWGGNDINYLDDYFDNVDITPKAPKINTLTAFRSEKFSLRDSDDTHAYIFVTGNLAANRNVSLPVLAADDTLAFIGIDNAFTKVQTITDTTSNILILKRDTSTNGQGAEVLFQLKDTAANYDTYGRIRAEIDDSTSGSEDGHIEFAISQNNSLNTVFQIRNDGNIQFGTNDRVIQSESGLTGIRTYTYPDATSLLFGDGVDNNLGDHYLDIGDIAAPANPSAGVRRLFTNSATGELSVRTSGGTTVSLESGGGGGGDMVLANVQTVTGAKTFNDTKILFRNPADTFSYTLKSGAITAARQISLPVITADDTLAVKGLDNAFSVGQTVTGTVTLGPNNRVILTDTGTTAARTFHYPDIGSVGGENATIKVQSHDYFEMEDEFSCGSIGTTGSTLSIGVLNWGLTHSTGGTPVVLAGVTNHIGIIQLVTGSSNGNNERIHLTNAADTAFCDPTDIDRVAWIVRIPTITSIIVRVGLMQDVSAASGGTAGAYFQFDSAVDADNWQTITRQASTSTTNTYTGETVVANDWFLLEARRLSGGNWEFYINNTLAFTHSANQPTTACNVGILVQTTSGAKTLDIDYFKIRTKKLGQRWT